jgi:hypothetical protein
MASRRPWWQSLVTICTPQERQPSRAVLGGGHVQAEDLPLAVGVDAGGDQGVHVDGTAALADLLGDRVASAGRVRRAAIALPEFGCR